MVRLRVGLCMAAATCACAAVMASSAWAAPPEFGRCVKVLKGTGKFSTGNCTTEAAGGSFEWTPGPGAMNKFTFALKAATLVLWETVKATKIICHGATASGEYTGPKSVQLAFVMTGCETSGGKVESEGQPEGVVLSNTLDGTLGVEKTGAASPKEDKVGLDLFNPTGGPLIEAVTNGITLVVTGSVITAPLKTNSMFATAPFKLAQSKGKQKPEHFEGEANDVLALSVAGGSPDQMGLALTGTLTNEEKIEINTFV